jgi:hypothetical protein
MTATSTAPASAAGGAVAVIEVALFTVNELAGNPPKVTAVVPMKLVPVMVTFVPPLIGPELGDNDVSVGDVAAMIVNAVVALCAA